MCSIQDLAFNVHHINNLLLIINALFMRMAIKMIRAFAQNSEETAETTKTWCKIKPKAAVEENCKILSV